MLICLLNVLINDKLFEMALIIIVKFLNLSNSDVSIGDTERWAGGSMAVWLASYRPKLKYNINITILLFETKTQLNLS